MRCLANDVFSALLVPGAPDECWLWPGTLNSGGYGYFHAEGVQVSAHRHSVLASGRDIPAGMQVDHLCRVRQCVNPAHLEVVTSRVNTLRGRSIQAANAVKTHCKRGHEFTPENTVQRPMGRECAACRRIHSANWRARRAAAA